MRSRLRDAILIIVVTGSLVATGAAIHDLGDRLPPPPEVQQPTAPPDPAVEAQH